MTYDINTNFELTKQYVILDISKKKIVQIILCALLSIVEFCYMNSV